MKSFFLSLGSNIDPISNLNSAINHLKNIGIEISCSNFYKSPSEGFEGEDFINCALGMKSKLDFDDLNTESLGSPLLFFLRLYLILLDLFCLLEIGIIFSYLLFD